MSRSIKVRRCDTLWSFIFSLRGIPVLLMKRSNFVRELVVRFLVVMYQLLNQTIPFYSWVTVTSWSECNQLFVQPFLYKNVFNPNPIEWCWWIDCAVVLVNDYTIFFALSPPAFYRQVYFVIFLDGLPWVEPAGNLTMWKVMYVSLIVFSIHHHMHGWFRNGIGGQFDRNT